MKYCVLIAFWIIPLLISFSWLYDQPKTVALIAERHLTPTTKAAVTRLLDGKSLADVSTAKLPDQPQFSYNPSFEYLNVPSGLNEKAFYAYINSLDTANMINAIAKAQKIITQTRSTKQEKARALKLLTYLVSNIHQPIRVGQSGSNIKVTFQDEETTLNKLWNSKLLDYQGKTPLQLTKILDTIGEVQVVQPKSFDPIFWAFESYYMNSRLTKKVTIGGKLGEEYYNTNIAIINARIKLAGLGLADLLNAIFDNSPLVPKKPWPRDFELSIRSPKRITVIELSDVLKYIGKYLRAHGRMSGYKESNGQLKVYLSAEYPNQLFTAILKGKAIEKFKKYYLTPEFLSPKDPNTIHALSVYGKVSMYNGRPEIEVSDPEFINSVSMTTIHEPWN